MTSLPHDHTGGFIMVITLIYDFLGIWDESTGQIIPKTAEREVKITKSFGPAPGG